MRGFHFFISGLLTLGIITAGCSEFTETAPPRQTTRTAISITLPTGLTLKPSVDQGIPGERSAAQVTAIHLSVTADDMETINADIPLDTLELVLDITSGKARTFTITLDTNPSSFYGGSSTVDLDPGANIIVAITIVAVDITAAPTGLAATAGSGEVSLSWNATTDATSYNLYWNETGSVATTDTVIRGLTGTTYTHTGLTGNSPYYYALSASNAAGESLLSTEVSATPTAADTTAPTTTASPVGGILRSPQSITLVCDDGATGVGCANTYYTTDGTTPGTSSTLYSSPIAISSNTVLKFFSIDLGGYEEAVKTEYYTIDLLPSTSASPQGGHYYAPQTVTLTCSDSSGTGCNATYYTSDGTTPTTGSTLYSSPLVITADTTLKFFSTDTSGGSETVQTESYTFIGWTYPTAKINPGTTAVSESQVAMSDNGDAIVVWVQNDNSANCTTGCNQVYASTYTSGSWTDPADLSTPLSSVTTQHASNVRIAMESSGKATVVWQQSDGSVERIYMNEYSAGWGGATLISDGTMPASNPEVAMNDKGTILVTWLQADGTLDCSSAPCTQIYYADRNITASDAWTTQPALSSNISPAGQHAILPQVALDNSENAVITWQQLDGTTSCVGEPCSQIFKSEYRSGEWTPQLSLTDSISPDGQHAITAQVKMNNNGNSIIVWNQFDGTTNCSPFFPCGQIFKSEYRSDEWIDPSSLTDNISPDRQHAVEPQLAMGGNGDAIIVWKQSDGTTEQVFRSKYQNGSWTDQSLLTDNVSPNGEVALGPQVDMNDSGDAVITWYQLDGTNTQIYKSELRGGVEVKPTLSDNPMSPDTSPSSFPAVAIDSSGRTIITFLHNVAGVNEIYKGEYR